MEQERATTRFQREPELLRSGRTGKAKIAALFGGQGFHNSKCLEELRWLRENQNGSVENLLQRASFVLDQLAHESDPSGFHDDYGFHLAKWLADPSRAPPKHHLARAPISFPLNTLLALAHYCIACRRGSGRPGQFRSALACVVGYSQGVFAASAVAQSRSWNDFWEAAESALRLSYGVGLESHRACPPSHLSSAVRSKSVEEGLGEPTPMLSVKGLDRPSLAATIKQTNKGLRDHGEGDIHLALEVSRDRHIVCGPVRGLWKLCVQLMRTRALPTLDQSQTPFPSRKPIIDLAFVPISAPFHSPYLEDIESIVMNSSLYFPTSSSSTEQDDSVLPMMDGTTGGLMSLGTKLGLARAVVRAVTVEFVEWDRVSTSLSEQFTHLLDFGPGHMGDLILQNTQGSGLTVIDMALRGGKEKPHMRSLAHFHSDEMPTSATNWVDSFGPRLLRGHQEDRDHIETNMTRLLGTPPVMVAGMTPTTMHPDVVAPIMKAGYHAELAGGGYHSEALFEGAIRELAAAIPPHRGVTCNLIYASPQTIKWQIACLGRLIGEGLAVTGITIGAGIPSDDIVAEYIQDIGLKHISFKPGSTAAIERVVEIARNHPTFPIGLQWTGGRAGGHHSYEDFHAPILAQYPAIRACKNIFLVVGSGFGGGEDSVAYLTGDWSKSHGYPRMPVDGISFGSRFMVCREARTSDEAKRLIVSTEGVGDEEWHGTYQGQTGGVVTIQSEMGQPIHVLATRGVLLWRELDARVFSIKDAAKRLSYLQAHHEEIITRLDKDYAKPWFPVNARAELVHVHEMTYHEILQRLLCLLYVSRQRRWIDVSYSKLVQDYLSLATARFGSAEVLLSDCSENLHDSTLAAFTASLGMGADDIVYPADSQRLMALFRQRGQKPVPFVPALDDNFETWFKKDCLWQAEDLDAVVGRDVQRVMIIQGPVAVRFSTTCDESAVQILERTESHYRQRLRESISPPKDIQPMSTGTKPDANNFDGLKVSTSAKTKLTSYHLSETGILPDPSRLLAQIAANSVWLRAALLEERVFGEFGWAVNPIRRAFMPRNGDVIEVQASAERLEKIVSAKLISGSNNSFAGAKASHITISLHERSRVSVTIKPGLGKSLASPLIQTYDLNTDAAGSRLYMGSNMARQNNNAVRSMYCSLWLEPHNVLGSFPGLNSEFRGDHFKLTSNRVEQFEAVISRQAPNKFSSWNPGMPIPIDFCVILAWEALIRPLMTPNLECDFIRLLHQSIDIDRNTEERPLSVNDVVHTVSRITGLSPMPRGKRIVVAAEVLREDAVVVKIISEFFIRKGTVNVETPHFDSVTEPEMQLSINSEVLEALARSRKWLFLTELASKSSLRGLELLFHLTSHTTFDRTGHVSSIQVSGTVSAHDKASSAPRPLGNVYFEDEGSRATNIVMDFLIRHGTPSSARRELDKPGWQEREGSNLYINAPVHSRSYSAVSADHNPIHVCPIFSHYAGLDGEVVHGMNTSAIAIRLLQDALGDHQRSRCRRWKVLFQDIVLPGDLLRVEFQHVAMTKGAMVVQVQVFNERKGNRVMEAESTFDQASTVYVFGGQGSQSKGMGMNLYAASPHAKALWDRGDAILREKFGFSILQIVRDNPKQLLVGFGGKRGKKIREKYLTMTRKAGLDNDDGEEICIVEGLQPTSDSHTFHEERGLLFSTQFSQPALSDTDKGVANTLYGVLMEMAEYQHLRALGMVQPGATFAGHSLGEYAALGACTSIMSLEDLLDLVFYRGLRMHNAITRDANGRTDYAMMAVDPSRVNQGFDEAALQTVIRCICEETRLLLEVVNYNVASQQYVCAGHFRSLWTLGQVLDGVTEFAPRAGVGVIHENARLRITTQLYAAAAKSLTSSSILERGKATIPLSGIDVPFHSTMLRGEIDHYRKYLSKVIEPGKIQPSQLVRRWVPNVTGKLFSLDKSYIDQVLRVTASKPFKTWVKALENETVDDRGVY